MNAATTTRYEVRVVVSAASPVRCANYSAGVLAAVPLWSMNSG
jgi:hypothetical protein